MCPLGYSIHYRYYRFTSNSLLILIEKGLEHDRFRYFDLFSIKHKTLIMKKTTRKLWHNTIFYKLCTKLNSFI